MLKVYQNKRDFIKTPEPKGETKIKNTKLKNKASSIFVIQEHHASHLHYDFRIEIQNVLKSWALPKGVPIEFNQKHLAVLTEDHPMEYAEFEGIIPEGQYGAGKVKIWDKGTFDNLSHNKAGTPQDIITAFKDGHILLCLHGKRLKDECFVLHKFKANNKKEWLIFKVSKEYTK